MGDALSQYGCVERVRYPVPGDPFVRVQMLSDSSPGW